jgi:hypothetical protein
MNLNQTSSLLTSTSPSPRSGCFAKAKNECRRVLNITSVRVLSFAASLILMKSFMNVVSMEEAALRSNFF